MCRTNSRSTASRSSRIGSKICARSAESGEFCIMSAKKGALEKVRFTILNFVRRCQRAKPLLVCSFRQTSKERIEIAAHLAGEIRYGRVANAGKCLNHLGNKRRFVSLATMRD